MSDLNEERINVKLNALYSSSIPWLDGVENWETKEKQIDWMEVLYYFKLDI